MKKKFSSTKTAIMYLEARCGHRTLPIIRLLAGLCWLALALGVPASAGAAARDSSNETQSAATSTEVAGNVSEPAFLPPPEEAIIVARAREAQRERLDRLDLQEAHGTTRPAPSQLFADAPQSSATSAAPGPATNSPPGTPQSRRAGGPRPLKAAADSNSPASESTAGKTLFSFQADKVELRQALAQFARANDLNIVPDNDVTGEVTLDVRNLPLDYMMRALLDASDCSWHQEGGLIRVRNTETRTFTVDYLRLSRNGRGHSSATLNSATAGSSGVGGAGAGASGGGGAAGAGSGSGAGGAQGGSSVNLTAENQIDFWKELKDELGYILTSIGKEKMSVNMTAGILQITDRPSALKRAENYLSGVDVSIHRQVDIEVKIYDVTLNDQFQFGIDWVHVAEAYGGMMGFGGATLPAAIGGAPLQDSALGGLNRLVGIGGGNAATLVFTNFNTAAAVNALKQQGNVEVISKPRIRSLNNQTALIKVGTEQPFFAVNQQISQSAGGNLQTQGDQVTTVTIGTILSITPQISDSDWISLDISPVLSSLVGTATSPSTTATAPILDTKQASTLVRVRDGVTVVLGGLIQTENAKNDRKVPVLGDIPGLGKLFTGTFRFKQKKELVIFVTPHIVRENESSVQTRVEGEDKGNKHSSHF